MARELSLEHGKTIPDSKGEIFRGLEMVEYGCSMTTHNLSDYLSTIATDVDIYNIKEPLGVTVGITPYNFPVMISLWLLPLATVLGNTIVLKPSEKVARCVDILAEIARDAGFPPNVVTVVHGAKKTVDMIIQHPLIKCISFVGTNLVGEYIYREGTKLGKRV